jgi:hypothetical protein
MQSDVVTAYLFRYRSDVTSNWGVARYVDALEQIAAQDVTGWKIAGASEIREVDALGAWTSSNADHPVKEPPSRSEKPPGGRAATERSAGEGAASELESSSGMTAGSNDTGSMEQGVCTALPILD